MQTQNENPKPAKVSALQDAREWFKYDNMRWHDSDARDRHQRRAKELGVSSARLHLAITTNPDKE